MILQQTLNEGSHQAGLVHRLKLHHQLIRGVHDTASHGCPTSAAATFASLQAARLAHQLSWHLQPEYGDAGELASDGMLAHMMHPQQR